MAQPNQRFGPYEILSAIGAGGMGEVYRARDTRLDRTVAIKVLPTHLADRAELRERFDREARTVASLNHPHICALYDIGHQDGTNFLVMEYLEGETLAERLKKGPLPLDQVVRYAIEIADALDKAHRKGITHRDLKPSNIMLTKSGTKLLDFGLAKLKQEASPAVSLSQRPTVESGMTAEGTILGTLQYMAPEQVEGKTNEIDARTDIFAFGAVVYEMATGKKAFEGKTSASVMAKILEVDPPSMASLQPMTPPALDRVVKRCLAKDREDRWQTARDVCEELKWIAEGGSGVALLPTASARGIRALGRRPVVLGVGALLGALIAAFVIWNLKPSAAPGAPAVSRFTITLPPGQQLAGLDNGPAVALSSDGTHLVYVARQGGSQQIYVRALDSLEVKPLAGTEGATTPFFSPDGRWLGFFAGGKLKKVSVSGGPAVTLGDAENLLGASWGSQGMIAFAPTTIGPLQQMPDIGGGTPKPLTHLETGDTSHRWPEFLPGGKAVLFAAGPTGLTFTNAHVAVESVGKGERRKLTQLGMYPRYAPSEHLIYAQGGSLMAVPFDLQRLTTTGAAIPVVEDVLQSQVSGAAQYSFSATGSLAYIPGIQSAQSRLVWVSRNGAEQPLAAPPHAYLGPVLSPDGRRVAVGTLEQETQIWLYDLSRETLTRLTFEGNYNLNPVWTPDGKRIAFESNKEGPKNIFWRLANGSGGMERLTTSENIHDPSSFSPDGQLLAFTEFNPTTGWDIWVLRMSDRKAQPFLRTPFHEDDPQFSPDGRWLAYFSNESGHYEVYVQRYPGPGEKYQISTEGGTDPLWNPTGRELFYHSGDKMMVVEISTQTAFTAGKPRMLFAGKYEFGDISPDGQRFLMLKPVESQTSAPTQINIVQNWFEELKRRVPTGK